MIHKIINEIPKDKDILKEIYTLAISLSYNSKVNEKNKNKFSRENSEISLFDALNICLENLSHWVIIYRDMSFINEESYWDFGVSTLNLDSDIFIFTRLTDINAEFIIKKFKLKILNY